MAPKQGLRMRSKRSIPPSKAREKRVEPGVEFTADDAQEARDLWQLDWAEYVEPPAAKKSDKG